MFSKNPDIVSLPLRNISITGRLAFLYTLSALATLAVFSVFFAWSLKDSMSGVADHFLNERLQLYQSIIEKESKALEYIGRDIDLDKGFLGHQMHYERVLDEGGAPLVVAPDMDRILPAASFAPPVRGARTLMRGRIHHAQDGRYYMLKAAAARGADGRSYTIQIGLDISDQQSIVAEKEQSLVIILVFGILAATGVGVLVARHALRPVRDITGVAEQITIAEIGTRTDPQNWPEELRSLAVAFNGMLDRLEESFASLSQSASNMAHELRNPINTLIGEAEIVLAHDRPAEEYRKTIESGVEEYQRLSRIINSILFLARAENPTTRIELQHFDAMAEVEKVCSFYEALAEDHDATIGAEGKGEITGDPLMFGRALSNLVANALYYSPPGVTVRIAVATLPDGSCEVTVMDTGYGIPEKELEHIFDRFFRGEKMRAVNPGGTGLGLPIVKSIMDLHGGTISIFSENGKGTIVRLRFPASDLS